MPRKLFFIIFLMIWLVPPFIKFFEWDSYTMSTVACIGIFVFFYLLLKKEISFKKYFYHFSVPFFIILSLNIIVTSIYFQKEYDIVRTIISYFLLIIFIVGAYYFAEHIPTIDKKYFDVFFKRLFYFYIIIIILSFIAKPFWGKVYGKPIFPYSEPSHLALFFAPVLCYNILVSNSKMRAFLIILGLIISMLIKNLTLLVSVVVIAIFIYKVYVLPILAIGSLMLYYFSDLEYFLSRVDFKNSQSNLSTLVYIKGLELIAESWKKTSGLGVGFQQLGIVEITTDARDYLIKLFGEDLNAKDGGFLASKIISEFGIIGAVFVGVYIFYFIRNWFKLKKDSFKNISAADAIYYSCWITFFTELLVRGMGYFTPSVFLFLVSVFIYKSKTKSNKLNSNVST